MEGERKRNAERQKERLKTWEGLLPASYSLEAPLELELCCPTWLLEPLGEGLSPSPPPRPLSAPEPSHSVGIFQSFQWPACRTRMRGRHLEATGSRNLLGIFSAVAVLT